MNNSNLPLRAIPINTQRPQVLRKPMRIARPRPIVQMLDQNKREIVDQFERGITELEIAKELRMKRSDVELVIHEMVFGRRMAA